MTVTQERIDPAYGRRSSIKTYHLLRLRPDHPIGASLRCETLCLRGIVMII